MAANRLPFVDNLRSMTIILVVTMHAAVTYSNFGRWYFMEPAPKDQPTLLFFGMYQSFLQAWFMGFLFFLAGYFVPPSYDRKGPRKWIADRAVRLGIPALIYMLLVEPFIDFFLMPMFRRGNVNGLGDHWLRYITSGKILEGTGPMWFAVALLIFSLVYAGLRWIPLPSLPLQIPSNGGVVVLILTIAICTFLVRLVQPIGMAVLNMQLCFFSQYVILFVLGIAARRGDWLLRIPYKFGMRWLVAALTGGTALWLAVFVGGGALSGVDFAVFNGGRHWQSAGFSLWESYFCVGTCLGLIVLFRDKFNSDGRIARFLSDNAFAVYVFHPPLLIAVTMALHPLAAPPIVRFAVASVLAIGVSFLAGEFVFRRVPLLKKVL